MQGSQRMNNLCVNFFGSPGSGKTVAASSIFAALKKCHVDVGLVTEYARMAVIEQNQMALDNQLYVWATQAHHIFCAYRSYQVVVTDSPIPLGVIYNANSSPALPDVIFDTYHQYNNFNIILELDESRPYSMAGRIHSFEESLRIQNQILELLENRNIPFVMYNETNEEELMSLIMEAVG
jgi:hypothetical protein